MKKIFLIAVGITAISLTGFSQAKFGIQIGGNLGFAAFKKGNTESYSNKPRVGVLAGFLADVPLGPISFRPELNFIQKGYRNETTYSTVGTQVVNSKVRLNYVELPLNFVYNVDASTGKFFFGLGPNFAMGLSGKTSIETTSTLGSASTVTKSNGDVKFSGDSNSSNPLYLKRFDFGGNILAGYTSNMGLTFNIGYTLGLSDISRNLPVNDDKTQKNNGLTLKVGYMFGGSSAKPMSTSSSSTGSLIF